MTIHLSTRWQRTVSGLTLMLLGAAAHASDAIQVVQKGIPHQAFFSIAFDGDYGIAVGVGAGAGSPLLYSEDAGKSWSGAEVPTQTALLGVGISGPHRVAVGQAGLILVQADNGEWQERDLVTDERLMNASVNASGQMAVVGAFGTVLFSDDAGDSWEIRAPDWMEVAESEEGITDTMGPNLYGVHLSDEGAITIAGEWGLVMRSPDAGASWSVLHAGNTLEQEGDATMFDLHVGADGLLLGVGQEGRTLRSEDDGQTWRQIASGTRVNLLSVTSVGNGRMIATGMRDMLVSDDKGNSWQRLKGADFTVGWYSGSAAPSGHNRVYVVGHSGRIVSIGMGDIQAAQLHQ